MNQVENRLKELESKPHCEKIKYYSRGLAKSDMKKQNAKHPEWEKPLTDAYLCPNCGFWHTTSMRKKLSRRISDRLRK